MLRPCIVCHMTMSVDGKVTGAFLSRPESEAATELYYELNRSYEANGFICGRVTMEESFTQGWYPDLAGYAPVAEKEDYLPEERSGFYAVAFDPKGRLGWKESRIVDEDPGYGGAQIVEVLTAQADPRYLQYLRERKIPYLFAGETEIDVKTALEKLGGLLGIRTLLLEGGSVVNGYFQRADAIDELSLVVAPVVAETEAKPLFTDARIEHYELHEIKSYENGVVWMNYGRKRT